MALELSDALSEYAASARLQDLPSADAARMVDAFVNWVGCALSGSPNPTVDAAERAYLSINPAGQHVPLGRRQALALVDAISIDCLSSAALGFDDIHLETTLHPTGPVAAALLGLARTQVVTGAQYLEALHIGMEVQCRIALAFASAGTGSHRGWYATGIAGGMGAAVAVGRLLGFSATQMRNAIGLAAARASGPRGTHSSMAAAYVPALAAESGFIAAALTRAGMTCTARALDGLYGLLELIAPQPAVGRALQQLGSVSEAARDSFKPYPAGFIVQPVIDACLSLFHEHGLRADHIDRLDLFVPPVVVQLASSQHPADEYVATTSIHFWAAAVMLSGRAGCAQAGMDMIKDPRNAALRERVFLSAAAELANDQCRASARTKDGRQIDVAVEHARGSLARPMSSADIDAKFMANLPPACSPQRGQRLLQCCRDVLALTDVTRILEIDQAKDIP